MCRYPPTISAKRRRVNHQSVGRWEHHCWNEPNWDGQNCDRKKHWNGCLPILSARCWLVLIIHSNVFMIHRYIKWSKVIPLAFQQTRRTFGHSSGAFLGGKKLPTSNQGSHIQRLEGLTSPCCAVRNYWYNKSSSAPLILQTSNLSEEMHCMGARFYQNADECESNHVVSLPWYLSPIRRIYTNWNFQMLSIFPNIPRVWSVTARSPDHQPSL